MGRPSKVTHHMLGLVKTGHTKPIEPMRDDYKPIVGNVVERHGMVLDAGSPVSCGLSDVMTEEERGRHLAEQAARVEAEMAAMGPVRQRTRSTAAERAKLSKRHAIQTKPLPGGRKWLDLKLVDCAGCRRVMLGEAEAAWVDQCKADPRSRRRLKDLPPLVTCRRNGRPLCAECASRTSKGERP